MHWSGSGVPFAPLDPVEPLSLPSPWHFCACLQPVSRRLLLKASCRSSSLFTGDHPGHVELHAILFLANGQGKGQVKVGLIKLLTVTTSRTLSFLAT